MRMPFKGAERTTAQDANEQKNLQKTASLESDEAKAETEQETIPESSDVQEDNVGKPDTGDSIVDDDGNDINEGESLPPNKTFTLNGVEYRTDDNGAIYSADGELLSNQTYYLDGHEYKTDDNGKNYEKDGKLIPNQTYCLDGRQIETDELGRTHMAPPVNINFLCKDKYDKDEYKRQVDNQNKGMNNLSLYDYQKNRESFKENGRNNDVGKPAQEKARQEAYADRVAENRRNGMSREEAESEADNWMKSQAALHDPDQIAGGDAANVTGMGDKNINNSIGGQWQYKIDAVDKAVQEYIDANNLSEEDMKSTYLNVNLGVTESE